MSAPQPLKADRRLYYTADREAIVEEGDVRGRFLVAGIGRMIGASDVERYRLKLRNGRVWYKGCPDFPRLTEAEKKELGYAEDKMVRKAEDKAAPPAASSSEDEDGLVTHKMGAGAHSDRNEAEEDGGTAGAEEEQAAESEADGEPAEASSSEEMDGDAGGDSEELPAWPLTQSPASYLKRYPTGPNAELARRHVEAAEAEAGGE